MPSDCKTLRSNCRNIGRMGANTGPADFSQPLEALKRCHQRLRSECGALRDLLEHMRGNGCDERARNSAAGILRYFDTAARFHHADEEEDLLPRMMAAAT